MKEVGEIRRVTEGEGVIFVVFYGEKVAVETVFKRNSGFYGHARFPGGNIEEGEEPEAAVYRELKEELGVIGAKLTHLDTFKDVTLDNVFMRFHAFLVEDIVDDWVVDLEKEKSFIEFQTVSEAWSELELASSRHVLKMALDFLPRQN